MGKIKVSELKCFDQVVDVIGKAQAEIELVKVLSLSKRSDFSNNRHIRTAFVWWSTPQGTQFWMDIDRRVNPYDRKESE